MEQEFNLLEVCGESDEIEIFACNSINELINFKWDSLASSYQKVGFFFHCVYLLFFNLYINEIYIHGNYDNIGSW